MQMRLGMMATAVALVVALSNPAHALWTWTRETGRWINTEKLPRETPQLQVEYARSLLLSGQHKRAYRETEKFEEFYGDSDYADQNQFLRGEIRLAQGNRLDAAREFQKVIANYPDSDLYEQVIEKQYDIADAYYESGLKSIERPWWRLFRKRPLRRSIEVYSMVIDNQPFTDAAAEAQYKVGLCHHTLKEYEESAFEYRRVIEDYSASDWVDEAGHGLATSYYMSALPPDYDQTPSQLAIDAVDDFKARFPGDARQAELDTQRLEMRERIASQRLKTAQFYEKRRRFVAARQYYEVVVNQFPETEAARKAQEKLDAASGEGSSS